RYLATASTRGVRIFDWTRSDKPVVHLNPEIAFVSVVFSRDSRYLAAIQMSGPPIIWEWQSEAERNNPLVLRSMQTFEWVTSVTFTPDNTLAVTAGRDGTLRLWDLVTGDELQIIGLYKSGFNADTSFTPDGRYLIA